MARTSNEPSVETRIHDVGQDLAKTFSRVIAGIPGGPHRPKWLATRLGLNAVLTSRLLKAAQQRDPIVVAHMMPGPEPLRRLLRAAEKKNVNRKLIRDAEAAVDNFQHLIDSEAGDRSALDAIISGWLPDARAKVELIAKQSVFRGVSQLLGTACDVAHQTVILMPGRRSNDRADEVCISNAQGLRRVRPGAMVEYDSVHSDSTMLTIGGEPVDNLRGLLLEQFCTKPLPKLQVSRYGDVAQYTLASEAVGMRSAVDLVHATYLPNAKQVRLQPGESPRRTGMAMGIDPPSKTFVFDVLAHEEIFPGQTPTLNIYRTAGVVAPARTARRAMDRLDVVESVQRLGRGIAKFRTPDTPAYQDIIRFVCQQRGWDVEELRGFRTRIEYAMYSTEVELGFDLPPA